MMTNNDKFIDPRHLYRLCLDGQLSNEDNDEFDILTIVDLPDNEQKEYKDFFADTIAPDKEGVGVTIGYANQDGVMSEVFDIKNNPDFILSHLSCLYIQYNLEPLDQVTAIILSDYVGKTPDGCYVYYGEKRMADPNDYFDDPMCTLYIYNIGNNKLAIAINTTKTNPDTGGYTPSTMCEFSDSIILEYPQIWNYYTDSYEEVTNALLPRFNNGKPDIRAISYVTDIKKNTNGQIEIQSISNWPETEKSEYETEIID